MINFTAIDAALAAIKTQAAADAAEIARLTKALADCEGSQPAPEPEPGPVSYIPMTDGEQVRVGAMTARAQCDDAPMNSMFRRSDGRGFKMSVESGDDWNGTERSELIFPRLASGKFTLKAKVIITAVTKSAWLLITQGHQSSNSGNPPASFKMQSGRWRVDRVSGSSGIVEVTLDRAYTVVPGTYDLHFAMVTDEQTGRIYVKLGSKLLADFTGAVGKEGDTVDPKCGIYRGDTTSTDTVEFVDLVVTDGFATV